MQNIVSGALPVTGITRFDPSQFPRLAAVADNFQFYRVKTAKLEFVPHQDANAYYQQESGANGLQAVTYIDTQGLNIPASGLESALNSPFAKRHNLRRTFGRTWKPMCIQSITLQDTAASTTTTNRAISPWLTTTASGLSVDRVGVGFYIPAILQSVPTTVVPTWEPRLTITVEFKNKQVGT